MTAPESLYGFSHQHFRESDERDKEAFKSMVTTIKADIHCLFGLIATATAASFSSQVQKEETWMHLHRHPYPSAALHSGILLSKKSCKHQTNIFLSGIFFSLKIGKISHCASGSSHEPRYKCGILWP